MPIHLAANVDWLFTELPALERFAAVREHGLDGVEILFPYGVPPDELAASVAEAGVHVALLNSPAGDWVAGDRGLALGDDDSAFEASIDQAASLAVLLGCPRVHVLSGVGSIDDAWYRYIRRLRWAVERLAADGLTMCLEPINPTDMPGYALTTPGDALRVLDALDHPSARLQLDLYHTWVTEESVEATMDEAIFHTDHVQIAGVPGRNEPDQGDIVLNTVLEHLEALGYSGWVGLEYRPRAGTSEGLRALLEG